MLTMHDSRYHYTQNLTYPNCKFSQLSYSYCDHYNV